MKVEWYPMDLILSVLLVTMESIITYVGDIVALLPRWITSTSILGCRCGTKMATKVRLLSVLSDSSKTFRNYQPRFLTTLSNSMFASWGVQYWRLLRSAIGRDDHVTSTHVKQVYPDLRIFVPLAEKMSRPDPNDCPMATEALAEFESVVSSISRRKLRARIWRTEDTLAERFSRFVHGIPAL